jgi:hypothetical protein
MARPTLFARLALAALACPGVTSAQTFYVATNGVDAAGGGTSANPWATITFALDNVPDGSLVLVRAGTYNGRIRIRGNFATGVTVRSEQRYQARLRHTDTVLTIYNDSAEIAGIAIEGFDIAHAGPGATPLVVQVQDGFGTETSRIAFRDNILHDSYNNDILKINNGASDVLVQGNVFYNQGSSDEHIDVNSVDGVVIEDNVFFNDYAASGRPVPGGAVPDSSSFVVVKDSNAGDDEYLGARNVTIRRNVFLGWIGSSGSNFVLFGEDGTANFEAFDGLVENNLMLGDGTVRMRAAFGVKGSRDIVFRANTVVGDLPASAFAMRMNREGANPVVDNVSFYNNIWSDPTGTMGADGAGSGNDFSDTPPADTAAFAIANNLYWNGGAPVPDDPAEDVNPSDDAAARFADPRLAANAGVLRPWWNGAANQFNGGFATIRDAFLGLVQQYGQPAANGGGVGQAFAAEMPADDIRGLPRGPAPNDIGAYERSGESPLFANGFE